MAANEAKYFLNLKWLYKQSSFQYFYRTVVEEAKDLIILLLHFNKNVFQYELMIVLQIIILVLYTRRTFRKHHYKVIDLLTN